MCVYMCMLTLVCKILRVYEKCKNLAKNINYTLLYDYVTRRKYFETGTRYLSTFAS